MSPRDRDEQGRAHNARRRDALGRPLPRGERGFSTSENSARAPHAALVEAQRLLDDGRPFTAHEVLEAVWKADATTEPQLWRGLAQLAVGITHAGRGNATGARSLLDRAAATLSDYAGTTPYDVDVDGLRSWAAAADGTGTPPRLMR